jgi:1,4-alpha-glucan branching enzyme
MDTTANLKDAYSILNGEHSDPFCVLGMHPVLYNLNGQIKKSVAVRVLCPNAKKVTVIEPHCNETYEMKRIHENGFFEVVIYDKDAVFPYMLEFSFYSGSSYSTYDPYSFLPVLSDYDLYLFNEGSHHRIYNKLGAHIIKINGIEGALFDVWAPSARRVSVIGNFNIWDGRRHQMRCLGNSGVWEIFIPGISKGDLYKYEIKTYNGELYIKSDPYAFYSELRPGTASIVYDFGSYKWKDSEWISQRNSCNPFDKPISIYEVHLGSWARVIEEDNRFLTYRELAEKLVGYVNNMGYTHVEFMPVCEHPFDGSWGYQITGYYSVTSRYGTPEDFMYLIDRFHQEGIGVIMDWVPGHFPKDGHGLARFDGSALYEHWDRRQGEHPDWGTHVFNYGRHEVRNFLISNAVFWFEKYHIDGLRVDAVASMLYLDYGRKDGDWIPNKWGGKENVEAIEFLRQLNTTVYKYFPGIMMIAEESTSWALVTKPPHDGGLGFSFKWNMGWMNDFLRYVSKDPIYRKYHHNDLTFSMIYSFSENFILVLSHDEVVHGKCSMISKMPGDYWQKFAGLRVAYGYMYAHPGKKLLYMGGEFGQFIEWDYQKSLDWHLLDYEMHRNLKQYIHDLNGLYKSEKAFYELDTSYNGFEWIHCNDNQHSIISFIRRDKNSNILLFICNFTPVSYDSYRIGVPFNCFYSELINSDSHIYGGSNFGNMGGINSDNIPFHGRPFSLCLRIPPFGFMVFKPVQKKG